VKEKKGYNAYFLQPGKILTKKWLVFRMKTVEKYIYKFLILHLLFLIIGQWLISNQTLAPYVSKIIYYEGVMKDQYSEIIETMNR